MKLLDLTLDTPAENVALDEALLEEAERGAQPNEVLRLWEPSQPTVVVGRSSRVGQEVQLEACRHRNITVLRRTSGGAAIVTGPGCLMYALVLSYGLRPELRPIERVHCQVLDRNAQALSQLGLPVQRAGTSDLAVDIETTAEPQNPRHPVLPVKTTLKFSGNSLRCKRTHLLYHGTLLYDFPVPLMTDCLASPPRQPDYRQGRDHKSFVTNLPYSAASIKTVLIGAWGATQRLEQWPRKITRELVAEKYSQDAWNLRH